MGIAEDTQQSILLLRANIIIYGGAANEELARVIAKDIADHWNEPEGFVYLFGIKKKLVFLMEGQYDPNLQPEQVWANSNPLNNYFRIEEYAGGNISYVDDIGCNTGYFKLDNLLNNSTTAAHEFGHTLGLIHPTNLDIRGRGTPGIMYPRGTITDPPYQYDPNARPGEIGGTLNPYYRKVLQEDIDLLGLSFRSFNTGTEVIGKFSNEWHEADIP